MVGAGYTLCTQTGDHATIVKLFRVAMLAVVVIIVASAFKGARARAHAESGATRGRVASQPLVPWFLWLFVATVVVNSMSGIPHVAQEGMGKLSRGCLVVAIAALGIKTSFMQLARAGWRPFVLILVETVWMAALVLGAILFTR